MIKDRIKNLPYKKENNITKLLSIFVTICWLIFYLFIIYSVIK